MAQLEVNSEIQRALKLIADHPSVDSVDPPHIDNSNSLIKVDATFNINLPSQFRSKGVSQSGVRSQEKVRFNFPSDFPLHAPIPSLRADFNRNLPHIQPFSLEGRVFPCIYDGDLNELLHLEGFVTILNQTAVWLDNAACVNLIDPKQGWEPVRRDSLRDVLVADDNFLRNLVDRRGGHRFLKIEYWKQASANELPRVHGQITNARVQVNRKSICELFGELYSQRDPSSSLGKSLALIVWPGKQPSGELIVNNIYLPETVNSVIDLKQRATDYSCDKELKDGFDRLNKCFIGTFSERSFTLAVILMVRRPFQVIGSSSPLELCPYVIEIQPPNFLADGQSTVVRSAAHQSCISRNLLARMSGLELDPAPPSWTLVGAGSLGSKIALHLARAGNGPSMIIDKSYMTPHNAARHALVPNMNDMQSSWMDAKARILTRALEGLNQKATAVVEDAAVLLTARNKTRSLWLKENWVIVNATASALVREAFASSNKTFGRVVEMSLFASGRLGVITLEGSDRNPSTTDLMAELYSILRETPRLASIVFNQNDSVSRQNTGQGCGSLTMTMSDGRVSLFAAGMSEYLSAKQQNDLPKNNGEILIGELTKDGLGLAWSVHQITPTIVVSKTNKGNWSVHVSFRAVTKMKKAVSFWSDVETGGVLIGRISEVSHVVHVVDVIDAPEDSQRSRSDFTLGTAGLRQRIEQYSETIDYSLYCLGTWHNHLSPGGPSDKDIASAKAVASTRLAYSISLVMDPNGFHALVFS